MPQYLVTTVISRTYAKFNGKGFGVHKSPVYPPLFEYAFLYVRISGKEKMLTLQLIQVMFSRKILSIVVLWGFWSKQLFFSGRLSSSQANRTLCMASKAEILIYNHYSFCHLYYKNDNESAHIPSSASHLAVLQLQHIWNGSGAPLSRL